MAKKPDYDQPFEIPQKFWNQLKEFSNGAYLVFYVDSFGEVQISADFDSPILEEGLRANALRFLSTMTQAQEISETQEFLGMNPGNREPGCDLDEEDED